MLKSPIVRLVAWSVRHPERVIALAFVLAVLSGYDIAHHFKINTDISRLLETDTAWSAHDHAMDDAFPQRAQTVLVVVEARAPEFADAAVTQPAGGPFFEHNGLLFLSRDEVRFPAGQLVQARPHA